MITVSKIKKVKNNSFDLNEESEAKPKSTFEQIFGKPKALDFEYFGKNDNHNKLNYSSKIDITMRNKK